MLVEFLPSSEKKNQLLEYIISDFSFITQNTTSEFFSSLLINNINIAFDADGVAFSIFGTSPFSRWQSGDFLVPQANSGSLIFRGKFTPGISYRVNPIDKYWKVIFNKKNGWLEIKDFYINCEFVKIFDGAIIGINCGNITGLWLRPHMIE